LILWLPILVVLLALLALTWLAKKHWPVITILLYSLWIAAVFTPVIFCVIFWLSDPGIMTLEEVYYSLLIIYGAFWPFWIFCAILIISQMLLLIIPIKIVKQRPKPQRSLWFTAIAAGILFAIVMLGIIWSIIADIFGDASVDGKVPLVAFIFLLANWIVWSCIFRIFARNTNPHSYIRRLMKWLLRGTILELLVAVPSHIIVRHKEVCCASHVTATGIATGLAVMLISFGPGIYFLYVERIKRKKLKKNNDQSKSK